MINQEQLQGNWQQLKGKLKKKWGKLTDDDLLESEGKRERLIGKITERYGIEKEKAAKKIDKYLQRFDEAGNEMKSLVNTVSDMAERANCKVHEMAEQCPTYVKKHPLTAVGAAVVTGAVVGIMLRRKH